MLSKLTHKYNLRIFKLNFFESEAWKNFIPHFLFLLTLLIIMFSLHYI
jgi:hypothetical protein